MFLNEIFEATKDELIAAVNQRRREMFVDKVLNFLHQIYQANPDKQSVGGAAFEVARAVDLDKIGLTAKGIEQLYRERYGVNEGYQLQLERDPGADLLVLNIVDTDTGRRTEVRGKPGYESDGYDPEDRLHQLLDRIGKAANVSELINGETVSINPKHPQAKHASTATSGAFNEAFDTEAEWVLDTDNKYQQVNEALDNPYTYSWVIQSEDEWAARARTESGAILDVRFEYGSWDAEWDIDFLLDDGYEATAKGDQFRIFATVVKIIKEWWKLTSAEGIPVKTIKFSADKLNKQTGKTGSREKLYSRFAQQFANSIGFTVQVRDEINAINFELTKPNVAENFADGKKKGKSRPGRVKRAGASCKGSVTDLRKRAKKYSGERGKMYHWCANMKSGRKKK